MAQLRSGTWATVFTDLVGSTAQRARLGDATADLLLGEHDSIVRNTVERHGGVFVVGTGDGAMVAFPGGADAVHAAVAIQQAIDERNRRSPEELGLRIGISLGDLAAEDDNLHGLAANEAARVCALADHGEILISDVVRVVAGSRLAPTLADHGVHELKGLPGPVRVWRVEWEPAEQEPLPYPSLLNTPGAMAFSGRRREAADIMDAYKAVTAGERRVVLIAGEPGIGKTRLASESARLTHDDGALVLYGRCDEELGVPFQPFAEALTWYCRQVTEEFRAGRHPGDLARLSPAVSERLDVLPEALRADPESEQYRLFDAVTSWIGALAAERPVVIVLDDLHWASRPTLLMLRHLLRDAELAGVLVIGTYRDMEVDRRHPLASMLADLNKVLGVERVALGGLDQEGLGGLLEAVSGQPADDQTLALVRTLLAETSGNPFFIGEVLRHLAERGELVRREGRWTSDISIEDLGIPQGIKEVLGQRLGRFDEVTGEVLRVASVVGRDFDLGLLVAVVDHDEDAVVAAIETAVGARLVDEIGGDHHRFAHALVRGVLLDEVTTARRLRLHRRIAEQLELQRAVAPALVAHHWLEAGSAGEPHRALEAALAAGAHANAHAAYDEALDLLERALAYARRAEVAGETELELLVALGETQQFAGSGAARDTLLDAARRADAASDGPRLARAMLARTQVGAAFDVTGLDVAHVALLERAAQMAQADGSLATAAQLMGILAGEYVLFEPERARHFAAEALALARREHDIGLIVEAHSRGAGSHWCDPAVDEVMLTDLRTMAETTTDHHETVWLRRLIAVNRGDLDTARQALAEERIAIEAVPVAAQRAAFWIVEAAFAHLDGRLEDARAFNARQLELAMSIGKPDAIAFFLVLSVAIGRDDGRTDEPLAVARQVAALIPAEVSTGRFARALLALLLCETDATDDAAAILAVERAAGFPVGAHRNNMTPTYLYVLSEVAARLNDPEAAAGLLQQFSSLSGRFRCNDLVAAHGAVDRSLGRLCTVLGDYDEADRYLAAAATMHERNATPLFLARTLADQAELAMRSSGDRASAQELVSRAVDIARRRDAIGVERYATQVLEPR